MTQEPKIAAIILAAGASQRFGTADKLLANLDNETVLGRSLAAYKKTPVARKIAIIRADETLAAICDAAGFETIINQHADSGIGTSIAAGIAALQGETHALIGLGDMPRLRPQTIARLCQASVHATGIAVPVYQNMLGHPRLFGAAHFQDLAALRGEMGGKQIIAACENIMEIAVNDAGVMLDIDTKDQLSATQQ